MCLFFISICVGFKVFSVIVCLVICWGVLVGCVFSSCVVLGRFGVRMVVSGSRWLCSVFIVLLGSSVLLDFVIIIGFSMMGMLVFFNCVVIVVIIFELFSMLILIVFMFRLLKIVFICVMIIFGDSGWIVVMVWVFCVVMVVIIEVL